MTQASNIQSHSALRLLAGVLLFSGIAFTAQAQDAYSGQGGHYLQLPSGYQQGAAMQAQPATTRPVFTGQGMGQGQVQMQPSLQPMAQGMQQPMQPAMQPMQPVVIGAPSNRLLPPEMAGQPGAMQQGMQLPVVQQPMQPMLQPSPRAMLMPAAAVQPESTTTLSDGGGTNVELRPACVAPKNHRAHKGINTSTTVSDDCLN